MKKVDIFLTEPQEDFIYTDQKFPAIVGGLGSGKTQGGTLRLINKVLGDRGANGAYYMPTYDLLKLRAMPGFEHDLDMMGIGHSINKSDNVITLHGYGDIILRSYDNPGRIIAYETAHTVVDELDTVDAEKAAVIWRKITERNRQFRDGINTIGCVTTPDGGYNGFIYKKWGKNPKPGYELIKAPTASNPYLPEDYIEQIMSNYDPILAQLYVMGEFVSLTESKVYHFFSRTKHHTNRALNDADSYLYIGLDFNVGGTCANVWIIEHNQPIAVDEFVSHDTHDFVFNLERYKKEGRTIIVYPDASGKNESTNATQTDIAIIEGAGFMVDAPEANPGVRNRINAVNALLSHERMKVNTDKCPNLTHAFETQGYDKKGKPEKFDEHPAIDDHVDSAGYFINQKFPIIQPAHNLTMRI